MGPTEGSAPKSSLQTRTLFSQYEPYSASIFIWNFMPVVMILALTYRDKKLPSVTASQEDARYFQLLSMLASSVITLLQIYC